MQSARENKDNNENDSCAGIKVTNKSKALNIANISLMALCLFGFGLSYSLFSPFFPTEAIRRGLSASTVGWMFGVFTLVVFAGSLVAGLLVNHLGPHFMIGSGALLAGGATILFGALDKTPANNGYVFLCFACAVVKGVGVALYNTAAYAVGASLFPKNISFTYAVLEITFASGCMIGPTLGGVLYAAGGFALPFYVVGAILLAVGFITTALLYVLLPKQSLDSNKNDGQQSEEEKHLNAGQLCYFYMNSLELWICSLSMTIIAAISSYSGPTLALYLEELGLTNPVTVGLIFLFDALAYTLVSLIVGYFIASRPNCTYTLMFIGAFILTNGFLTIGPVPWLQTFVKPCVNLTAVSFVIISVGKAIVVNPIPTGILQAAKSAGYKESLRTSGMVAAIYNATWFLGASIGTPLAGALHDRVGFSRGSFVMAVIGAFVMAVVSTGIIHYHCSRKFTDDDNTKENENETSKLVEANKT